MVPYLDRMSSEELTCAEETIPFFQLFTFYQFAKRTVIRSIAGLKSGRQKASQKSENIGGFLMDNV